MPELKRGMMKALSTIFRDAAIAVAISMVVAIGYNAVNAKGIEIVAAAPYDIYVPCPEPLGEVTEVDPDSTLLKEGKTNKIMILDASSPGDFRAWHYQGATNVPFDYIEPVSPQTLRRIAGSGATAVVVYGDGGEPDSGHELARELAGNGIRNVSYVKGGGPALKNAGVTR